MRSSAFYFLVVVAIAVFAFVRIRPASSAAATAPTTSSPSSSVAPNAAPASSERGWVGILVASRSVDVSPRGASLVRSVAVRAGETVKQGATLANLEARDKATALRAATAAAKNQAEKSARSQRMRDASLMSIEEAESAKLEAQRQAAEMDLARILVDDAVVRAPFDGVIVARFVEPGMHVSAGTPMLRLVDPHGARVRFGVPSEIADAMTMGQTVWFTTTTTTSGSLPDEPKKSARIMSISPEVDRSAALVVIEADAEAIGSFRSGSQVIVHLGASPP